MIYVQKENRKQVFILLSAVWQCDYENQLLERFRSRMLPPLEDSWSTCVWTQEKNERKKEKNSSKPEFEKFFNAFRII